jgi:small multidrug resistance family-3 protein
MSVLRSIVLFALAALARSVAPGWSGQASANTAASRGSAPASPRSPPTGSWPRSKTTPNFGRILAAYGGLFVAGSLAWGVALDGFKPDRYDIYSGTRPCGAACPTGSKLPRGVTVLRGANHQEGRGGPRAGVGQLPRDRS